MSVDKILEASIDSAVEQIGEENAVEQAKSEDLKQSDSPGESGDLEDLESGGEGELLEAGENGDEAGLEEGNAGEEEGKGGEDPPPISDEAITRAVRAGLSIEEAKSFFNEESLNNVSRNIEEASTPKEPKQEEQEAEEKADILSNLPMLDPEIYGEEAIQMFDKLTEVIKSQQESIDRFESQHEDTARASANASAREAEQWFDGQVKELGSDFTDALGTGNYSELVQGSPQQAKREALADQVAVLLAGYEQTGKRVPPRDDIFSTAAKLVFMDEYQEANKQQLTKDLKKRSEQHINRASGRQAKTKQSPEDEVAAILDEKFFS